MVVPAHIRLFLFLAFSRRVFNLAKRKQPNEVGVHIFYFLACYASLDLMFFQRLSIFASQAIDFIKNSKIF